MAFESIGMPQNPFIGENVSRAFLKLDRVFQDPGYLYSGPTISKMIFRR